MNSTARKCGNCKLWMTKKCSYRAYESDDPSIAPSSEAPACIYFQSSSETGSSAKEWPDYCYTDPNGDRWAKVTDDVIEVMATPDEDYAQYKRSDMTMRVPARHEDNSWRKISEQELPTVQAAFDALLPPHYRFTSADGSRWAALSDDVVIVERRSGYHAVKYRRSDMSLCILDGVNEVWRPLRNRWIPMADPRVQEAFDALLPPLNAVVNKQ